MKLDKEFINKFKKEKIVVNTKTQEEYDKFMQFLENNSNLSWFFLEPTFTSHIFSWYKNNTCIKVDNNMFLSYAGKEYYVKGNYKIIDFSDLEEEKKMFKVGDKVKCISNNYRSIDKGQICEIAKIDESFIALKGICDEQLCYAISDFRLVEDKPQLSDIKERWIVKFRNGKEAMLESDNFRFIENGKFKNGGYVANDLASYNDDLKFNNNITDYDIVGIYKPRYETVWEAPIEEKETIKEKRHVTMQEVCKKFGEDVVIDKEDK